LQFVNLSSPPIPKNYKSSARRADNRDNTELPAREDISSTPHHCETDRNSGGENTDFSQNDNGQTSTGNEHAKGNGTKNISQMVSPLPLDPAGVDRSPSDGHRSAVQGLLALGLVTSTTSPSLSISSTGWSPSQVLSSPNDIDGWNLSAGHTDSRQEGSSRSSEHSLGLKSFTSLSAQYQTPGDNELAVKNLVHEPSEVLHFTNNRIPPHAAGCQLDEWRKYHLLRHYRYEVATWVCHLVDRFGT
jgi:hypothetical protein